MMHFGAHSARQAIRQIRAACRELRIDEELTDLIVGSYRRDRAVCARAPNGHEDVRAYVRRKLALWRAIFEGPIR